MKEMRDVEHKRTKRAQLDLFAREKTRSARTPPKECGLTSKGSSTLAQTELFGTAIILVLLVLIATFAIKFFIGPKSLAEKTELRESIIANNALNALLKTTLCGKQMQELITRCYFEPNTECGCEFVKQELEKIGQMTNYKYEFSAAVNKKVYLDHDFCTTNGKIAASPYKTSQNSILFEFTFMLCSN